MKLARVLSWVAAVGVVAASLTLFVEALDIFFDVPGAARMTTTELRFTVEDLTTSAGPLDQILRQGSVPSIGLTGLGWSEQLASVGGALLAAVITYGAIRLLQALAAASRGNALTADVGRLFVHAGAASVIVGIARTAMTNALASRVEPIVESWFRITITNDVTLRVIGTDSSGDVLLWVGLVLVLMGQIIRQAAVIAEEHTLTV